jgi:hypothetical protein
MINEFNGYLEDNATEKSNQLTGIEVAQGFYRDFVAKRDKHAANKDPNLKKLRRVLMELNNEGMEKLFSSVDADEFVVLFGTIRLNRIQNLLRFVPKDALKDAFNKIGSDAAQLPEKTLSLIKKSTEIQHGAASTTSPVQKRLMLRILKSSTPDDEEFIQSLVSSEDWDMKSLIMKTRFLFRDLPYVQPAILKRVFESFPVSFRADLFFVSSESNRNTFLSLYAEGARARDLLTFEVSEIEKSEKRRDVVMRDKNKNIQTFLQRLHDSLAEDPGTFDDILNRLMQSGSIAPGKSQGGRENKLAS